LPLAGLGEVFYKGEKRQSAEVLKQLDWQPLALEKLEENAMISGSQYLTASGLYALKKCAQLLKMANIIAALYFKTVSYSPKTLYTKLATIKGSVGQGAAIAAILAHLEEGEGALENEDSKSPYFASAIATVYGATVDAFHFALDVFLKEVNSVTENLLIFPEDELILPVGNANYALAFALDSLTIALTGFANLCEKRIDQLVKQSGQILPFSDGNSTVYNKLKSLYDTACVLGTENKRLSNPASVHTLPENIAGTDASTAMKCLQVVENLEKMLAIELMCATEIMQVNPQIQLSPFLERFVSDFRQQTLRLDKSSASYIGINKAANFIASYME
jgi:histidine ammonia-lyase